MILLMLLVAVIVAYLFMTQMNAFGMTGTDSQTKENAVEQAKNAVDQINEKIKESEQLP